MLPGAYTDAEFSTEINILPLQQSEMVVDVSANNIILFWNVWRFTNDRVDRLIFREFKQKFHVNNAAPRYSEFLSISG